MGENSVKKGPLIFGNSHVTTEVSLQLATSGYLDLPAYASGHGHKDTTRDKDTRIRKQGQGHKDKETSIRTEGQGQKDKNRRIRPE